MGLSSMMGRSKVASLIFLKDKVRSKIKNWDGRWFSQAGREILVKTVVQALPTYTMSIFLLPNKIIQELESMFSEFWWGASTSDDKHIHWKSWSRLCRHKSNGGMGFP